MLRKELAKSPPKIKPTTLTQGLEVIKMVKKPAVDNVRKNSAKFTDPIVDLGSCPDPIKFVVTIGPHPPPPAESIKTPNKS